MMMTPIKMMMLLLLLNPTIDCTFAHRFYDILFFFVQLYKPIILLLERATAINTHRIWMVLASKQAARAIVVFRANYKERDERKI
jgi:hypothetical protein